MEKKDQETHPMLHAWKSGRCILVDERALFTNVMDAAWVTKWSRSSLRNFYEDIVYWRSELGYSHPWCALLRIPGKIFWRLWVDVPR
jgi:hypothetical protein